MTPPRRFPLPPTPSGWFSLSHSDELPRGGVVPVIAFGRHLVLYRGEDGVARALDAFCPHLGAHLGHGGRVEGTTIRCPFHAWQFDETGMCTQIPYAHKVPAGARIHPWRALEQDGHVLVWFDARGAEPAWTPEPTPEMLDAGWMCVGRRRVEVRGHLQDLAENAVDSAHFVSVHGFPAAPVMTAEPDRHMLHVRSQMRYPEALGGMEGTLRTSLWGLGLSAVRFTGVVDTLVHAATTPIDAERVQTRFSMWMRRLEGDMNAMVSAMFQDEVNRQIDHDVPIWENKIMHERPVLCEGDGTLSVFRRWARALYRDLTAPEVG